MTDSGYTVTKVVNEGDQIQDIGTVRLLMKSILRVAVLPDAFEPIVQLIWQHAQGLPFHDVVPEILLGYLGEITKNGSGPSEEIKLITELAQKHLELTKSNRIAYTSRGKTVPTAVTWPNPTERKRARSTFTEHLCVQTHPLVNRETPMGSAGSCFAAEIAWRLQDEGYNYLITEQKKFDEGMDRPELPSACAAWGTIFNVPALRQLVEKSFGERKLPKLLWHLNTDNGRVYHDPFREGVTFPSVEAFEADYDSHLAACREALTKTKVFVMTLGMNEVWRMKSDGTVFSRCPWNVASSLVEPRVMTVQDNVNELKTMLSVWRKYNPDVKLIVTVSPVPLHATFRANDHHVITANCHSKSTLRVAAEEFVSTTDGVFYFPSYETVMYTLEKPWQEDQRHVAPATINKVMDLFTRMFVTDAQPGAFQKPIEGAKGPGLCSIVQ